MRRYNDSSLEVIFSQRLEEAMFDKGLTKEDLEAADIINTSSLGAYLHGDPRKRTLPQLRTAVRIAEYLGVSLDWLCGLDDYDESLGELY